MEAIYAEVELINVTEMLSAKRGFVDEKSVGKMCLKVIVNSGAWMMAINENIQAKLHLPFIERRKVRMPNDDVVEYEVVGPLMIKFANRTATCSAFVLPGDSEPLLGFIPLQEMDVLIHSQRQELIVNPAHPNYAQLKMKTTSAGQHYENTNKTFLCQAVQLQMRCCKKNASRRKITAFQDCTGIYKNGLVFAKLPSHSIIQSQ